MDKDQQLLEEAYVRVLNEFDLSKLNPFKKKQQANSQQTGPKQEETVPKHPLYNLNAWLGTNAPQVDIVSPDPYNDPPSMSGGIYYEINDGKGNKTTITLDGRGNIMVGSNTVFKSDDYKPEQRQTSKMSKLKEIFKTYGINIPENV